MVSRHNTHPVVAFVVTLLVAVSPFAQAEDSLLLSEARAPKGALWIESLPLSGHDSLGGPALATTVTGKPLSLGGVEYQHGVGTNADSEIVLAIDGDAVRFVADVGIDDHLTCVLQGKDAELPSVVFEVWVDGEKRAASEPKTVGAKPTRLEADVRGGRELKLLARKTPGAQWNHASWAGAALFVKPGSK